MANWIRHAFQGSSSLSDRMTWYANNIPNFSTLYDSTDNEGIIRITQETVTDTFDFYPKAAMTDGRIQVKINSAGSTSSATFCPVNVVNNNATATLFGSSTGSRYTTTSWMPNEASCPLYLDTLLLSNDDLLIRFTYEQVRAFGLIAILQGQQIESGVAKKFLLTTVSDSTSPSYPNNCLNKKMIILLEDNYWNYASGTNPSTYGLPFTTDMTANGSLLNNYLLKEFIIDGVSSKIYEIYGPSAAILPPFIPIFINGQEYMTLGQGLVIKIEYD